MHLTLYGLCVLASRAFPDDLGRSGGLHGPFPWASFPAVVDLDALLDEGLLALGWLPGAADPRGEPVSPLALDLVPIGSAAVHTPYTADRCTVMAFLVVHFLDGLTGPMPVLMGRRTAMAFIVMRFQDGPTGSPGICMLPCVPMLHRGEASHRPLRIDIG